MVLYLAAWIAIVAIASVAAFRARPEGPEDALAGMWSGVLGMVLLFGSLMVLMPWPWAWALTASMTVAMLLLGPGIGARVSFVKERPPLPWMLLLFLVLGAAIAYEASRFPIYFDTAFYHLQLVRIVAEFGVLEGAALLHPNFGQVSLWFSAAAAFLMGDDAAFGVGFLNGLFALLAIGHTLVAVWSIAFEGRRDMAVAVPAIAYPILLLLALRWDMIASLSPDFPVMILIVVVGWTLSLEKRRWGLAILAATVACLIKVSAAPLAIVVGVWAIADLWRKPARLVGWSVAVAIAAGCYVHASIAATGCAVFPVTFTCVDVPWALSDAAVDAHAALISAAALGGGRIPLEQLELGELIARFVTGDTSGAVIVVSYVVAMAVAATEPKLRRSWAFRLAAVGGLFVLVTAPTGRFLIGYAALAWGVALPRLLDVLGWRWTARGAIPLLIVGSVLYGLFLFAVLWTAPGAALREELHARHWESTMEARFEGLMAPMAVLPFDILAPVPYTSSRFLMRSNGYIDLIGPTSRSECWATVPPCAPRGVPEELRLADPERGVAAGFRAIDGS